MTTARALRWTLLVAAATAILVAGCYVREEARETCVLCGATRTRTTLGVAGFESTRTGEATETRASEIHARLVSSDGCSHLWGGGPAVRRGHFLFIPLGAEKLELPGAHPGYRHTIKVLLAVSRLDDPAVAPEFYRFLVSARPAEGEAPEKFIDELGRCMSRLRILFPTGEVPDVVNAKALRELESSGERP